VSYKPFPLGQAKSLTELGGSLAFFTPAILFLKIGMHNGPFADFQAEIGKDVPFYHHRFNSQIFKGLESPNGNQEWNHVLFALPSEHSDAFLRFMDSIVMMKENGSGNQPLTVRVGLQALQIEDPLMHDKAVILPPVIPSIDITVLGADTNIGMLYMEPGTPAQLCAGSPSPRMQKFARDMVNGKNPHTESDAAYYKQLFDAATKPKEKPDD
jgi:hypothetical protein